MNYYLMLRSPVEAVMNKLNHRPRKTLKFKTPHTVFFADTLQEAA
jgi:IS30 family transposase